MPPSVFLPDFAGRWAAYRQFVEFYQHAGWLGLRDPLPSLVDYHLRFGLALSPVELLIISAAVVWLLHQGDALDRRVLAAGGLAALLLLVGASPSYGYWAALAPFAAYAIARAVSGRTLALLAVAGLPALAAIAVRDMAYEIGLDRNAETLAAAELRTGQIPPGARVATDDLLWCTLHEGRTVWLWTGLERFAAVQGLTLPAALRQLNPDVAVCRKVDGPRCAATFGARIFKPPQKIED